MKLTSNVRLRGHLTIRILDSLTKRERERIEILNTVCEGAELAIERLLAQRPADDPDEEKLWSIYCGTDNTPPAHGDTELGTAVFAKACDQPMVVSDGGVAGLLTCQMTMEAGDGNGNTFKEAGLYTRGGQDATPYPTPDADARLVARQIHSAIAKDASITIEYTWRFQVAAS